MEHYNFKQVEKKWQKYWEENNSFYFKPNKDNKKNYYVLEMFPYPSGQLHIGHVRNFSIGDVIARFKVMQGYNVLHPMGADAFGLPAENAAIKHNIHPHDWTEKNIEEFKKSMKSLGFYYDYSKFLATCFPEYYGKQQEIFIDLYNKGLIYRKESYVNWDPIDQTVLANEQVVNGRGWRSGAVVERKKLNQWFFKITNYAEELLQDIDKLDKWPEKVKLMQRNWIGKSSGALIDFKIVNYDNKNVVELHCQNPYFDYLKNGIKTIEGRKNSPKYQKLKKGDIIKFYCDNDSFYCEITKIDKYKNLRAYLENNDLADILPNAKNIEDGERIYRSFSDNVDDCEFLGIHVKRISEKKFNTIRVYSTRPDTLFGASFIGISSNHPLAEELTKNNRDLAEFCEECKRTSVDEATTATMEKKGFNTGLKAINPFTKEELPIYVANFILMDYGTGAVFGCPAHDERDYEFAKKYNLPIKQVVSFSVNNGDVLPFTDDGYAMNSGFLNGLATNDAKEKAISELERLGIGEKKINYRLRDWGFSRQRYWGCPIPVVYCEDCGAVLLDRKDLPLELPKNIVFDGKGNPLEKHPTWKYTKCPHCGKQAIRETDTMDTFVDSSWYFMRYPELCKDKPINNELCNEVLPIDLYVGGIEHATMHLIYFRFFTKALRDCGYFNIDEPAKGMFNQGMVCHKAYRGKETKDWCFPWNVQEKNGKFYNIETEEELSYEGVIKMSKSKSNVVDNTKIVDAYGADAVRMFVLSDSPADKDFEWTEQGIEGCWKYISKFYRMISNFKETYDINKINYNNNIIKETHKAIKFVTEYLDDFEFNKAIAKIREFTNFVEKLKINSQEEKESYYFALINVSKLFLPFAPHLCSELLERLNIQDKNWPIFNQEFTIENTITIAIQINGKLRATIEIQKDLERSLIEDIAKEQENVKKYLENATVKKIIIVPNRLVNIVI